MSAATEQAPAPEPPGPTRTGRHRLANAFTILVALVAVSVAGLVAVMLVARPHRVVHRFDTYEEVQESGLMDQGWFPSYLPRDMHDIHAVYDLDTSQAVIRFSIGPEDMRTFVKGGPERMGYNLIDPLDDSYLDRAEAWIPHDDGKIPDLNSGAYSFYGGRTVSVPGPVHLAVDGKSGTVYHWLR